MASPPPSSSTVYEDHENDPAAWEALMEMEKAGTSSRVSPPQSEPADWAYRPSGFSLQGVSKPTSRSPTRPRRESPAHVKSFPSDSDRDQSILVSSSRRKPSGDFGNRDQVASPTKPPVKRDIHHDNGDVDVSVDADSSTSAEDERRKRRKSGFERYLAGQSVMKSEVQRIIAEASKGSKFYNREVEKDRQLNARVDRLLRMKDDLMRTADIGKLEREANNLLTHLESTRDLSQFIVHVDMDAFYANVEVKRDPSLKGKAFGVGKGVLTTASYEARAFGCRSGMASFVAKKLCPQLILVETHFPLYTEASNQVRDVLAQYDENLCMVGMDEGYLNITSYMSSHGMSASEVVSQLRAEVHQVTGLTISAGIAPNTMLAKICSDRNKPNGQFELDFDPRVIREFMRDLPIRRIPGIGRVTERILMSMGVDTCGDIYKHRAMINAMDHYLGLRSLLHAYLGLGSNVVQPGKREERKSVGCERTFRDKSSEQDILDTLAEIAAELEKDLGRTGFAGKTVTVKFKHHTYEVKTRQTALPRYVNKAEDILPVAQALLVKEFPLKLRLLGIRMTHLKDLQAEGQGLQQYFQKSPSKPSAARARSESVPGGDDDDDEVQIVQDFTGDRLECPICGKRLRRGASNAEVNLHVDKCLQSGSEPVEIVSARSPPPPLKVKRTKASETSAKTKKSSSALGEPVNAFERLMRGK